MKRTRGAQLLEREIQTMCNNYLRLKGYYVMRLNAGQIKATNKYGKQHMVALSRPGTPDTLAFKRDQFIFIEYKRPGKENTDLQQAVQDELKEYGARVLVIHDLSQLQKEMVAA